jgi:DNA-binding HxlR family transcriptional regulator
MELTGMDESSVTDHTVRLAGRLSPRGRWQATACSVARALDVVSSKSALLILREAFYGTSRFDDFAERVGISEPVAAARLRELVADGLLEREPYRDPGQRTRMAYRLTDKGAELLPVLVALMRWGDRWLQPDGPPVELRHSGCGEIVTAGLRCAAGHDVPDGELDLTSGPGARAAGGVPARA